MNAANEFQRARAGDPETSHAAAAAVPGFASAHFSAIVEALKEGPATKTVIAARTGLDGVAVARRLPELQKRGAVEPTGETRPSATGRPEREWRLTTQ